MLHSIRRSVLFLDRRILGNSLPFNPSKKTLGLKKGDVENDDDDLDYGNNRED